MTQLALQLRHNVTVLAVLVPEGAETFCHCISIVSYRLPGTDKFGAIDLPPGKWEIIGLLREVSEETVAELVGYFTLDQRTSYQDYTTYFGHRMCMKAIDSLKSAITASDGNPEANYLLLKQIQ